MEDNDNNNDDDDNSLCRHCASVGVEDFCTRCQLEKADSPGFIYNCLYCRQARRPEEVCIWNRSGHDNSTYVSSEYWFCPGCLSLSDNWFDTHGQLKEPATFQELQHILLQNNNNGNNPVVKNIILDHRYSITSLQAIQQTILSTSNNNNSSGSGAIRVCKLKRSFNNGQFLSHTQTLEILFKAIGAFPGLERLDILDLNESVSSIPWEALSCALHPRRNTLQKLCIRSTHLRGSDRQLVTALSELTRLETIVFYDSVDYDSVQINGGYDRIIEALSNNKNIELRDFAIDLSGCTTEPNMNLISPVSVQRLLNNNKFGVLRNLSLIHLPIHCNYGNAFFPDGLNSNRTIKVLDLSNNMLNNDTGLAIAAALRTNNTIEKLLLNNVQMGDDVGQEFSFTLAVNQTLRVVDLSNNIFYNAAGIGMARALDNNNGMEKLLLENVQLHPDAATAIAQALARNVSLCHLSLHGSNQVNYVACNEFIRVLSSHNSTLQYLDISSPDGRSNSLDLGTLLRLDDLMSDRRRLYIEFDLVIYGI